MFRTTLADGLGLTCGPNLGSAIFICAGWGEQVFSQNNNAPQNSRAYITVSVIECFETDGGVNYRSDRLIWF